MNNIIIPQNANLKDCSLATLNPLDFEDYVCECGCKIYTERIIAKKVPVFYQTTIGTDIMDFRYLVCHECGELHEVFAKDPTFRNLLGE